MTHTRRLIAAGMLLAGTFGAANIAYAFPATPMDKAELAQLTPQLRSKVQARLGEGETVHGVLETMLLNRVSQDFATDASSRPISSAAISSSRGRTVICEMCRSMSPPW